MKLILVGMLFGILAPQGVVTADEVATTIVTGKITKKGQYDLHRAAFVMDGCRPDRPDGLTAAFVNLEEYRGRTLRITALHVEREITVPILIPPWGRGVIINEYLECSLLSDHKRHRRADDDEPRTFVVTGTYLMLTPLWEGTIDQHYKIELIEER